MLSIFREAEKVREIGSPMVQKRKMILVSV